MSTSITFERPVGPYADTKELEYISALLQTCKDIRKNGTVRAEDIQHFLSSRHGVRVTEEMVTESVVYQLGGSLPVDQMTATNKDVEEGPKKRKKDGEDEEEEEKEPEKPVLDVCQLAAMLLIPFFRKAGTEDDSFGRSKSKSKMEEEQHSRELVGHVLDVALRNILAEIRAHHPGADTKDHGVLMDAEVLRHALEAFGEFDVPGEVLEEMILQAQTDRNQPGVFFDKSAFLHALTGDTQLYDPARIDGSKSTHFDDARKAKSNQQLALLGKANELSGRRQAEKPQTTKDGGGEKQELEMIYMANNIDNTADTYWSTIWFILVWVEAVLIYFAYMLEKVGNKEGVDEMLEGCNSIFGCAVLKSLLGWIFVFFQLMIIGFTWVFLASLGNTTHPTDTVCAKIWQAIRLLIAMLMVLIATVLSFFYDSETGLWSTKDHPFSYAESTRYAALIFGIIIMLFQLVRLLGLFLPLGPLQSAGMEKKEMATKSAAAFKVQSMVEHAMLLHGEPPERFGESQSTVSNTVKDFTSSLHANTKKEHEAALQLRGTTNKALLNFHRMQDAKEEQGGVIWTLKRVWSGELFAEEGVYLHGRLLAVNMVQFFIAAIMISVFVLTFQILEEIVGEVDDNCILTIGPDGAEVTFPDYGDDWNTTVNGYVNFFNFNATHFSPDGTDEWPSELLFEGSMPKFNPETYTFDAAGVDTDTICIETYFGGVYTLNMTTFASAPANFTEYFTPNIEATKNSFIEAIDIKRWQWQGAVCVGLIFAIIAVLAIACSHVPSFTSSVLKLRSGVTPSLKAAPQDFAKLRSSPDNTGYIFGNSFWGCLYTAAFVFFLMAGLFFLCAWGVTWPYMRGIIAGLLGMAVTIVVKMIIFKTLRGRFYSSFYRKRPAASSIMGVILECYSLGLSAAIVGTRFGKLVGVTALYIGRIDVEMLAPGVGFGMDSAPKCFKLDLLSHEAHRHPFIERIGLLCLLKLYNGKEFATRAGAYWRMLFVLALMPWMRNYRVRPGQKLLADGQDDEKSEIFRSTRHLNAGMEDDPDVHTMQFELDLAHRANDEINARNKELKAVLLAARDKIRELREQKRELKKENRELKKTFTGESQDDEEEDVVEAEGTEETDDLNLFSESC